MEKKLKKCYENLDLPYSATKDEVKARKNALIKILNAKAIENNVSNEKEITLVENSANAICEYIEKNGIPKDEKHFEATKESIVSLIIVFLFACMVCFFSFYTFL